jgi:hypothetical protein
MGKGISASSRMRPVHADGTGAEEPIDDQDHDGPNNRPDEASAFVAMVLTRTQISFLR